VPHGLDVNVILTIASNQVAYVASSSEYLLHEKREHNFMLANVVPYGLEEKLLGFTLCFNCTFHEYVNTHFHLFFSGVGLCNPRGYTSWDPYSERNYTLLSSSKVA
jgi:hypothetical protein